MELTNQVHAGEVRRFAPLGVGSRRQACCALRPTARLVGQQVQHQAAQQQQQLGSVHAGCALAPFVACTAFLHVDRSSANLPQSCRADGSGPYSWTPVNGGSAPDAKWKKDIQVRRLPAAHVLPRSDRL